MARLPGSAYVKGGLILLPALSIPVWLLVNSAYTEVRGKHPDGTLRYQAFCDREERDLHGYCFDKNGLRRELDDEELDTIIFGSRENLYLKGCDDPEGIVREGKGE